jgi:hypothetical protein
MASRELLYGILLISIFSPAACEQSTEVDEGGPGLIVPGKSVEGIKLGDTKETVEAKLGRPTSVGWVDGLYRGWRHYTYAESSLVTRVNLQFLFIDNGGSYGPIDEIVIGPAYRGKTKEGVSVGSALEKVHQVYGMPAKTLSSEGIIADKYCLNGKKLEVHYKDSVVTVMSTGYFVPMPQDDPCR